MFIIFALSFIKVSEEIQKLVIKSIKMFIKEEFKFCSLKILPWKIIWSNQLMMHKLIQYLDPTQSYLRNLIYWRKN